MQSMSHLRTSMQGKMGFMLDTICRYDHQMFGNTRSSSALMFGSLCGTYFGYSSRLILLKRSRQCGSAIFEPVLASVSPKVRGWMKTFFVFVLMKGFDLEAYSNFFVIPGEETSPTFGSFSFDTLGDHLVVGFLGGIVPATKIKY
jgi:hypothetical protein